MMNPEMSLHSHVYSFVNVWFVLVTSMSPFIIIYTNTHICSQCKLFIENLKYYNRQRESNSDLHSSEIYTYNKSKRVLNKRVEFKLENTDKLRLSQKEIRLLKMRAMPKSITDIELICLIEDEMSVRGKKKRRLTI